MAQGSPVAIISSVIMSATWKSDVNSQLDLGRSAHSLLCPCLSHFEKESEVPRIDALCLVAVNETKYQFLPDTDREPFVTAFDKR